MTPSPVPASNRLLQALPKAEQRRVLALCETVRLEPGDELCERNGPLRHVHFPVTSFISLVVRVRRHEPLEIGLIGNEGMLGATLALGIPTAPLEGVVQCAGTSLRAPVAPFRRLLRDSPALEAALKRYLYVTLAQGAQSAACNRFHPMEARLARWLLMSHDRAQADDFYLTHRFLAMMLGVRRSGVTIAAGGLQRRGLIRYVRGRIHIVDRAGLEAAACECYDVLIEDYERILA